MSEIGLFVPCYMDELWPQAAIAATRLLEALGHRVVIRNPVCCGQVLSNSGDEAGAKAVSQLWAREHADLDLVLILSASCTGFLQRECSSPPIREFCAWMEEFGPERYPRPLPRRFAYHASCSSQRETQTAAATRSLLGRIEGLQLQEAAPRDECCGFGGSFATKHPQLSVRMGQDRLACLLQGKELDGVVSADLSCLLHLRGIAAPELRMCHVAELLWEACDG
ncbi:MAG: Fe-S oxidoreductase [Planctomycetota bacterium]|nr:MAG: Fe-S oxidoreductase [Planctomycetota bacterium]